MEWKQFTESPNEYPEVIVEKIIEGFSKATNGLVDIVISEKRPIAKLNSKLDDRFQFECVLYSKKLSDYSFPIFEMGYDVEIFPVDLIMEYSIYYELAQKSIIGHDQIQKILTEDKLVRTLELIFQSTRFVEIVSGVMKIAKKKDSDLPF